MDPSQLCVDIDALRLEILAGHCSEVGKTNEVVMPSQELLAGAAS